MLRKLGIPVATGVIHMPILYYPYRSCYLPPSPRYYTYLVYGPPVYYAPR